MHTDETIVAVASSHEGDGLRGVVRISGPDTLSYVRQVFVSEDENWRPDLRARRYPGKLQLGERLGDCDCDLYLWPTSRSYTHQPTAELHTYGSRALLQAVVGVLSDRGARLARPGEFTLRAFLAGRIDLAQAEAVLGVIDAVDGRALQVALTQLAGGLSQPLMDLRDGLLNLCADLEAGLDFVDEDIEFISTEHVLAELSQALETIDRTLRQVKNRDTGQQLPRVVLRGEPNAGKSSLWNRLVGDARAIVTDQAGTTRDYLTATVTQSGIPFLLVDTAGVESPETALQQAVRRTTDQQAEEADLVICCIDSSRLPTSWEREEQARLAGTDHLLVGTKSDLLTPTLEFGLDVLTSTRTGDGVHQLGEMIAARLEQFQAETSVVANTASRCRESLRRARDAVDRALSLTEHGEGEELVVAEVRLALEELGQVVGTVYTDDILDRVFSRFCIGK